MRCQLAILPALECEHLMGCSRLVLSSARCGTHSKEFVRYRQQPPMTHTETGDAHSVQRFGSLNDSTACSLAHRIITTLQFHQVSSVLSAWPRWVRAVLTFLSLAARSHSQHARGVQPSKMDERTRAKQIQQMVNFMKLEARDKASEIRLKTKHDCMLERQKLVMAAKRKLEAEFLKREKRLEVAQRVYAPMSPCHVNHVSLRCCGAPVSNRTAFSSCVCRSSWSVTVCYRCVPCYFVWWWRSLLKRMSAVQEVLELAKARVQGVSADRKSYASLLQSLMVQVRSIACWVVNRAPWA